MAARAFIRESECIGCTKCLAVCPTDAIVGANNLLHTVIEEDCIGCKLCVPVCPVDCIEMRSVQKVLDDETQQTQKVHFRFLAQRRKERLKHKEDQAKSFFLAMRNKMKGGA